jgi:DNA-binding PadR family transcriptional regulator
MKELTRKEEQIMLAIQRLRRDAYLITIREKIRQFTGNEYSVGTIFAPLNRLEMNGYVASYSQNDRRFTSKKPIKFYKLTDKGVRALAELQKVQAQMWRGVLLSTEE